MLSVATLIAASMVSRQAEGPTPEDVDAAMQYLVGSWDVEGDKDGNKLTATFTVRWAPARKCLRLTFKGDSENATGISGPDPSTNELVEILYLADGTRIENRYSHFAEKVWEGTAIVQQPSGETDRPKIQLEKTADGYVFTQKSENMDVVLKCRRVKTQKSRE
jgi:hypothetical protein